MPAMNESMPATAFDRDLVARYDVDAPRYTSYPTAPHFRDSFGEADLLRAIRASNGDPIPRDLSVYVHVPFCLSPCSSSRCRSGTSSVPACSAS